MEQGLAHLEVRAVPTLIEALDQRELEPHAVAALIRMGKEASKAAPALGKRMRPEKPYWMDLVRFLADIDPETARKAIPDLRSLGSSGPIRDKGIVNFRQSQNRIEEAKKLLKKLGDTGRRRGSPGHRHGRGGSFTTVRQNSVKALIIRWREEGRRDIESPSWALSALCLAPDP